MASFRDSINIEKLNDANYSTWQFKAEMLLIKEDLLKYIKEDPPATESADWDKKDQKARALINLIIEDRQILHTKNEIHAKGTWEALKRVHQRTNLSSKLYLLRKLYSTKLEEGGNMQNHIANILEVTDKLKAIGEDIKDEHLSALLLCSLPSSYDTLITALEARPETELNVEFIKGKLTDEYNKRKQNSLSTHDNNTRAFNTQRKPHTHAQNYNKKEKFCSYCRLKSHTRSECWHLKKQNNFQQNKRNTPYRPKPYKQNNSAMCYDTHGGQGNKYEPRDKTQDEIKTVSSKLNELAFTTSKTTKNGWIIDSGSSSHITNNRNNFSKLNNYDESEVMIADGKPLKSYGSGEVNIRTKTATGEIRNIKLQDVLYVPEIESNLLSVKKATENGCTLIFQNDSCKLKHNGKVYLEGKVNNNLYEVVLENAKDENRANIAYQCSNKNCIHSWHKRMGHKNFNAIKEMISKNLANGIQIEKCNNDMTCETCIESKLTNAPYPKQTQHRAKGVLELIHTDLCGPMQTQTIGGKSYFLTFIDDYSRFTFIYLLSKKSEVFDKLKQYVAMTKNKFGKTIQTLRSDNGGEYTSGEIENYLNEMGIHHQFTVPFSPSQNGVSERKNRSLIEMTRSLLNEANLPHKFWGEAVNTATYLQNRLPTKSNPVTPYEMWTKEKPNLSHLKTFGCKAYFYVQKHKRGKLDDKAEVGTFVGYDYRSKGYRIYQNGKNIIIARTVKFIENVFPYVNAGTKRDLNFDELTVNQDPTQTKQPNSENNTVEIEIQSEDESKKENVGASNAELPPLRQSERINKGVPPDRLVYLTHDNITEDPKSWDDIMNMNNPREKQNWLKATQREIKSLTDNKTWVLVDPPPGKKVIGSRWTFKTKYDSEGKVQTYKARLVAKGFLQKYGEDYDETFAPVVSHTTIRSFLACATYKKLKIKHIDINTAFLHGELEEEVYMTQPEGYTVLGKENKVCLLQKAIYGLKQAARAWHLKISKSLKKLNFVQSTADSCLFTKKEGENTAYIIVYVDDILIAGNDEQLSEIIDKLKSEYELKDLGEASYYLGIKIDRIDEGTIALNQKTKIEAIVKKFNLENARPYYTPMDPGYLKNYEDENPLPNNTHYRSAIGALLYIATVTRPDISAAVNILSRRNESPRKMDWAAVKRIISYLNTTKNLSLTFNTKTMPILTVFSDSDWAGDTTTRKSTSGNLFLLGENPIQWITKRQSNVAMSSAEAEYVSAANASQEILWIVKLLEDLHLPQQLPITMHEDNQAAIKMVCSDKFSARTKHIDIKYNCIKQLKQSNVIDLVYCPSESMLADILTKPAPRPGFEKHRSNLQLLPYPVEKIKGEYWKSPNY